MSSIVRGNDGVCGEFFPLVTCCSACYDSSCIARLLLPVSTPGGSQDFNQGEGCSGVVSWWEARNFCEGVGARLCTEAELLNDETKGSGNEGILFEKCMLMPRIFLKLYLSVLFLCTFFSSLNL